MPGVMFEPVQGVQSQPQAQGEFQWPEVPQVVSAQRGQQEQADVGRRGTVGGDTQRLLLKMIWGQPVVVRADETLEVQPGASRQLTKLRALRRSDGHWRFGRRPADPPRHLRRHGPRQQQRCGHPQPCRMPQDLGAQQGGEQRRAPHLDPHPRGAPLVHETQRHPCGGRPFQQVPVGQHRTSQRLPHRAQNHCALVGEEHQREQQPSPFLAQRGQDLLAGTGAHAAEQTVRAAGRQRHRQGQQRQQRPRQRCTDHAAPGQGQQRQDTRRQQAAQQVVRDFPAPQAADRGAAPAEPGQELPVAAHPAFQAPRERQVVRGRLLDECHVAHPPHAPQHALQKVVAEHLIFGNMAFETAVERLYVVQTLACEDPVSEHILIRLRNRLAVQVKAPPAGQYASVDRILHTDRMCFQTRLKHRESRCQVTSRVEAGPVERVVEGGHEFPQTAGRQLRVCVEGEDIPDTGQYRGPLHGRAERTLRAAQEQRVELRELAAFAFPAQKALFCRTPLSGPVKQVEDWAVAVAQRGDASLSACQQGVVTGHDRSRRVGEIADQRELHVFVPVAQVMAFQQLQQRPDLGCVREQARNSHQRQAFRR